METFLFLKIYRGITREKLKRRELNGNGGGGKERNGVNLGASRKVRASGTDRNFNFLPRWNTRSTTSHFTESSARLPSPNFFRPSSFSIGMEVRAPIPIKGGNSTVRSERGWSVQYVGDSPPSSKNNKSLTGCTRIARIAFVCRLSFLNRAL